MGKRGRPRYPDVLTPREWEVLSLLREGLTNDQIAERLVTLHAARYHVSEILSKLGVATREEAAAWQPEERPAHRWSLAFQLWLTAAASVALIAVGVLAWGVFRGSGDDAQPIIVRSTTSAASQTPAASESPTSPPVAPSRQLTGLPVLEMQIVNLNFAWTRTIDGIVRRPLIPADQTGVIEAKKISPPEPASPWPGIGGAFFLDEEHGWFLTSEYKGYPPIGNVQRFVYRTSDGGQTWLSASMGESRPLEADRPFGRIEFIDPNHGWVLEVAPTSTQSSIGTLYGTDDGGATWTKLNAPSGEPIHFTDVSTGWQTSGPFTGTLYVTHDGGVTWTSIFPTVTPGASPAPEGVAYGLPTKLDDGSLLLPASRETVSRGTNRTWSFQLMRSVDGGETWNTFSSAGGINDDSVFDPFVSFIFPSGRVVVIERNGTSLVLPAGSTNFQPLTAAGLPGAFDLQFADEKHGWALINGCYEKSCQNDLLPDYIEQTDNGGQTWTIVNSPGYIAPPPAPTPTP
jgi:DNA-binding CsgD family transcriptional regulator